MNARIDLLTQNAGVAEATCKFSAPSAFTALSILIENYSRQIALL